MKFNEETVLWIPGYENEYGCTSSGKVVSYKTSKAKELKGSTNPRGYLRVTLNGKAVLVHRLIAMTFIPTVDYSLHIDHIDENKLNNTASNLRWCTIQENLAYYYNNSVRKQLRADRRARAIEVKKQSVVEGKHIKVNGVQYLSCGSAARFIVEQETLLGITRSVDTVRKELSRYVNKERPSWIMYGKYLIE